MILDNNGLLLKIADFSRSSLAVLSDSLVLFHSVIFFYFFFPPPSFSTIFVSARLEADCFPSERLTVWSYCWLNPVLHLIKKIITLFISFYSFVFFRKSEHCSYVIFSLSAFSIFNMFVFNCEINSVPLLFSMGGVALVSLSSMDISDGKGVIGQWFPTFSLSQRPRTGITLFLVCWCNTKKTHLM